MTVERAKWGCLGLVMWVVWSVGLAAELSEAAQAKPSQREVKQYQRHAIKALEAKDAQGAIRVLKKLETVMSEQRWEFLYVYGTLLVEYWTTAAERKKGHDMLVEVMNKIEEMGKEDDPYYQPYYLAALDRDYALKEQEEAAFGRAEAAGTAAAYAEYLAAYPQGPHAEAAEFGRAEAAGTAAAYAEYLAAYPRGTHAEEAEAKQKKRAAEEEARRAEAERARQAKLKELLETETFSKQMVHVQGGMFRMGCTAEQRDCDSDENPVHLVRVSDFEIGKYEVTQEMWEAIMGETSIRNCSQCPVQAVGWKQVQTFLKKLNAVTGARYRLPTEAEWEYAARGGQRSEGYQYAGSHRAGSVGWHDGNSGGETHPVGQKRPNELGLYDMSGNVWEWTQDCWNDDYRGAPADGRAWEREDCSSHVQRGGAYTDDVPDDLRTANRKRMSVGSVSIYEGFRLARTLTP